MYTTEAHISGQAMVLAGQNVYDSALNFVVSEIPVAENALGLT